MTRLSLCSAQFCLMVFGLVWQQSIELSLRLTQQVPPARAHISVGAKDFLWACVWSSWEQSPITFVKQNS